LGAPLVVALRESVRGHQRRPDWFDAVSLNEAGRMKIGRENAVQAQAEL